MQRGGYVLSESAPQTAGPPGAGQPGAAAPVVFVATGSEVAVALEAQAILAGKEIGSRVVSMPCPGEFLAQTEPYRRSVLPRGARAVVIEAARLNGWESVVGPDALLLGIDRFGASAPYKTLAEKSGFTGSQVADRVLRWIGAA
jgi:transketolase